MDTTYIGLLLFLIAPFVLLHFLNRRSVLYGFSALGLLAAGVLCFVLLEPHIQPNGLKVLFWMLGMVILLALISSPLAFALFCLRSGFVLNKREGRGLRNMLSIGLGLWVLFGLFGLPVLSNWLSSDSFWSMLLTSAVLTSNYLALITVSYVISLFLNLVNKPHHDLDYVVVLGAGLRANGSVTPLLASRIRKDIDVLQKNPKSFLVLSGGQGADEPVAEAVAMGDWAREQGVDPACILQEDQSRNTHENVRFSYDLIEKNAQARGLSHTPRLTLVTNRYHLLRALLEARHQKISCIGYGSATKLYFFLNALIREVVGYLFMRRLLHGTVMAFVFVGSLSTNLFLHYYMNV